MKRAKLALAAAALFAAAGAATGHPLRLDYCVEDLGGGTYRYSFFYVLDNNDNSWAPGQGWRWFIFGDQNQAPSPLTNFIGDPASLPVGPWTGYSSSGGGHNGPTFSSVLDYWIPAAVGETLRWQGTSTADLQQGQLLYSNIAGTLGGALAPDFAVANRLASCAGQPSGACCRPDGVCFVTTQTSCTNGGGIYRGDGTTCPANCPQPATGACCLDTGCSILTQAQCTAQNGTYRGDNVTCAIANCPPGTAWQEQGDAGDLPATAQVVGGSGPLSAILGSNGPADADMYQIQICDAASFQATTVGTGINWDTMLFLFDATGHGVVGNDDAQGTLQSTLTNQFVPGNGQYYLAISRFFNAPHDGSGRNLWNTYSPESRPDGPGAAEAIGGWTGGSGGGNAYRINLSGSCFVSTGPTCYPDCDLSHSLNVNDFVCFQGAFAGGNMPLADCNRDNTLNVNDFVCFQSAFAAGCSAP